LRGSGDTPAEAVSQLLLALWAAVHGEEPPPPPSRWVEWETPADLPPAMALVELLSDALYRVSVTGEAAVVCQDGPGRWRVGLGQSREGLSPRREVKAPAAAGSPR